MIFKCNCGVTAVEISYKELMKKHVTLIKCPSCNQYITRFRDSLGVSYVSHSLAKIQEMRDETKAARDRIKPLSKRSNSRSKKGESASFDSFDPAI